MHTITVDLQDRIEEIDDRLAEIEDEAAALREQEQKQADDDDTDDEESDGGPPTTDDGLTFADLEDEHQTLTAAKETVEDKINEWGGSEFEIREFAAGHIARINDQVRAQALHDDVDPGAKEGARRIATVNVGTTSTPPSAPTDAKKYPNVVKEFLYERIEQFNEYGIEDGDFSAGNSSLEAALSERDSPSDS